MVMQQSSRYLLLLLELELLLLDRRRLKFCQLTWHSSSFYTCKQQQDNQSEALASTDDQSEHRRPS